MSAGPGPVGEPRAVDGRVPGHRGRATRARLLDTTLEMLETTSYRDLRVVDVARAAGTSPATFYQYFADIEAAVLVVAAQMAESGATELQGLVDEGPWDDQDGFESARRVADGFLDFWSRHRALIRVIDLAALEGDMRFRDLRTWLLNGASTALQRQAAQARDDGRLGAGSDDMAIAAVLTAMLAHVASHRGGIEEWGVETAHLRDAMAGVILQALTGALPAAVRTTRFTQRGDG